MSLQGYATAVNQTNEIIAAYASGSYQPVASNPAPWVVLGSFTVPAAIGARLCVSGFNSGPAALTVALYAPGLVAGSTVVVSGDVENEALSQPMSLLIGAVYQIAAQYLGASGSAAVRTVSLRSL
jgi:hypothetical protein